MATLGTQLAEPPGDGISSLRFSAASDLLLAASWDGVRSLAVKWERDQLQDKDLLAFPVVPHSHHIGC